MNYVMSKLIPNVSETPFDDLKLQQDEFIPLNDIVGAPIEIIAYKKYMKDDSEGIFIAFRVDGKVRYTATHAIALVKTFDEPMVKEIMERGDVIDAVIVTKVSKKTGRTYYCFE